MELHLSDIYLQDQPCLIGVLLVQFEEVMGEIGDVLRIVYIYLQLLLTLLVIMPIIRNIAILGSYHPQLSMLIGELINVKIIPVLLGALFDIEFNLTQVLHKIILGVIDNLLSMPRIQGNSRFDPIDNLVQSQIIILPCLLL
jgi:hypothetical protein